MNEADGGVTVNKLPALDPIAEGTGGARSLWPADEGQVDGCSTETRNDITRGRHSMGRQIVSGMVEAPVETGKIRSTYSWMSKVYFLVAWLEKKSRTRSIALAQVRPTDVVLEVAVGIGYSFVEFLKQVDPTHTVYGVDLTPAMLEKTKALATKRGYTNFELREADARQLPFPDETFDILYNSYMLDLIPAREFPIVLKEFHRVLKKNGRLVLLNMSKRDERPVFYETIYRLSPYLLGGCRPVLMETSVAEAGFGNIGRETMFFPAFPSEIVTATKPGA
jgi:ubiquinone/menaquinone biosynthesis C-methylase UbiE